MEESKETECELESFVDLFWVPKMYKYNPNKKPIELTIPQRIFLTFEAPLSSPISEYLSVLSALVIALSIAGIIISTISSTRIVPDTCDNPACNNDPIVCPGRIVCSPVPNPIFDRIDLACVVYFTIDFGTRLLLVGFMPTRLSGIIPDNWDELEADRARRKGIVRTEAAKDPHYHPVEQVIRYIFSFNSIVDIVSIVPTYISLASDSSGSRSFTLARVLRLARIFRVMRINQRGRMVVDLLNRTFASSREAILILLFYLCLVVIFFATLVYIAEGGYYVYNEDYPDGAYIRPDGFGGTIASPFRSIPTTIYFVLITITTVGYGDLAPTTSFGRAVVSTSAIVSILVLALPITIMGSNFSREYEVYVQRVKAMRRESKYKRMERKKALRKKSAGGQFNILAMFAFRSTQKAPVTKRKSLRNIEQNLDVDVKGSFRSPVVSFSDDKAYQRKDSAVDQINPQMQQDMIIEERTELMMIKSSVPLEIDEPLSARSISSAQSGSAKKSSMIGDALRSIRNHGSTALRNVSMRGANILGIKEASEIDQKENDEDDEDDEEYSNEDDEDEEDEQIQEVTTGMLEISSADLSSLSKEELQSMFLSMRHAYCKIRAGLQDQMNRCQKLIDIDN